MQKIELDYIKYNHKERYFITLHKPLNISTTYVSYIKNDNILFKTYVNINFYKAYLEGLIQFIKPHKLILIEHTSANLDPEGLHLGNLSTGIIGNYIANFNSFIGYKVITTYWVNDRGTRILRMAETLKSYPKTPISKLYQKYISLEKDNNPSSKLTENLYNELGKKISKHNLKIIVSHMLNLGITYDRFDYETDYINKNTVKTLKGEGYSEYFLLREKKKYMMTTEGIPLYLKSDINYTILEKLKPVYDEVYTVVGKDHQLYFSELDEILVNEGYNTTKLKWIYVPIIKLKGEKMSKSKQNVIKVKDILKIKYKLNSSLITDIIKLKILSNIVTKKECVISLYTFFVNNIDLWYIKYYLSKPNPFVQCIYAPLTNEQIEFISEILNIKINYVNYTHLYTELNYIIKRGLKFFRYYFFIHYEQNTHYDYELYLLYTNVYSYILRMILNDNTTN
jgi:hypothetical protein